MTLSVKVRQLAKRGQYGHSRTPRDFYMSEGGCSFYWGNGGIIKTVEEWDRACRLLTRYRRFYAFIQGWQDVPGTVTYWADNSRTVKQVSRQGVIREHQLVAAGGDVCY